MCKKKKRFNYKRDKERQKFILTCETNTFEKFFITTIITGIPIGMGIVLPTWFVKAFMQTLDEKTVFFQHHSEM